MKLLYTAAPYRAKTTVALQQNIADARLMAMYYWNKGYAVICPHMNNANFDGLVEDKKFLHGTMLMLSKCDAIAMHPNWQQSSGCRAEHNFMLQREREIANPGYANDRPQEGIVSIFYPEWSDILTILNKVYREG